MHGLADGFLSAPPDEFGRPSPLGEVALHGVPRARQWDTVASVSAELPGDAVHFTALPDGTLLVEEEVPDGALTPLADAIEVTIAPPYRAEAVRRDESVWAVGAKRIRVREFPEHEEDELELVEDGQVVAATGSRATSSESRDRALGGFGGAASRCSHGVLVAPIDRYASCVRWNASHPGVDAFRQAS